MCRMCKKVLQGIFSWTCLKPFPSLPQPLCTCHYVWDSPCGMCVKIEESLWLGEWLRKGCGLSVLPVIIGGLFKSILYSLHTHCPPVPHPFPTNSTCATTFPQPFLNLGCRMCGKDATKQSPHSSSIPQAFHKCSASQAIMHITGCKMKIKYTQLSRNYNAHNVII